MTANLRLPIIASLAIAAGALFSSCTYDPYRYGGSSSVSSSVGYSSNNHVSSSIFVSTSSSRWGYDPHRRSYYDYSRKCYYDPYLRGYYPRGFRPPVITGVPHPHGWRRGMSSCPPPRNVRNHYIKNHRNRYQQYCGLNHSWAHGLKKQHRTPSHSNSIWNRTSHPSNHSRNHLRSGNTHDNRGNQWGRDRASHRQHANSDRRNHRPSGANRSSASAGKPLPKHPVLAANAKRSRAQAEAARRAGQARQAQARQAQARQQEAQARQQAQQQAQAAAARRAAQQRQAQAAAQARGRAPAERKPVKGRVIR